MSHISPSDAVYEVFVEMWEDEHHTKIGDDFHYADEVEFASLEEARSFYDAQILKHKDNKLFKWITLKKYVGGDEDGVIIDEYNPPPAEFILSDAEVEYWKKRTEDLLESGKNDLNDFTVCSVNLYECGVCGKFAFAMDDCCDEITNLHQVTEKAANSILETQWYVKRCAQIIQALTRGILTRRKIHFALLSADPDALERIM